MQKALGLHYRSQELFSSLSYQILFPGRLNRSLGECQNYRVLGFTVVCRFYFKQAIKHMILSLAADFVFQAPV
jgi:hypothetical protein